jgi:hypothetical protein
MIDLGINQSFVATSILVALSIQPSQAGTVTGNGLLGVSNPVVEISMQYEQGNSAPRGGAISSLKVFGTETIDTDDQGRSIQASVFISNSYMLPNNIVNNEGLMVCPANQSFINTVMPGRNVQNGGDMCGRPSPIYDIGTSGNTLSVGVKPYDWGGAGAIPGFYITGHHTVGPLPYINTSEVIKLTYHFIWDGQNGNASGLKFQDFDQDADGKTPVPFVPAIYFKASVLPRLFGLSIDGSQWVEVTPTPSRIINGPTPTVASNENTYRPSLFRFRAMAYMTQDLGWGVGLYGRQTISQTCATTFNMSWSAQAGQCPNFVAQNHSGLTNNLTLIDQTLSFIPKGSSVEKTSHIAVGNLGTIQSLINNIYNSGN